MGLLFVLVWVSLTALAGGSWRYLATRRRRRISAFAAQMGLSFSAEDTFGLVDHAFDLFNLGDLARCRNVVWGTFEGVEVKSGDLYFVSSSAAVPAGMDRLERGGLRFVFAETEVDAFLPHVSIRHRDWVPEGLQPNELPFESDDFNRRFLVRGDDRRFAYGFVDARMMQWLLDVTASLGVSFEASGKRLIASCGSADVSSPAPLMVAVKGFRDRIPAMVLREYPLHVAVDQIPF